MSSYKFNLDLHSSQSQVSLAVKQYDTDRSLEITLSDGSEAFILPAFCVAVLLIKKPNGTAYSSGGIIEYSSVIKFDFAAAVAADPGINICELKIYSGDKIIASPSFTMIVSDRAVRTEDISIPEGDVLDFDTIHTEESQRRDRENRRNINEYGEDGTGETSGRVYNENQRIMREDERVAAENERAAAENERAAAEEARAAAESGRESNEETRMQNEYMRIGNESDRIEAEKSRNEAESNRNNNYETAEENRYLAYNNAEASRNEEYSLYEADRENSYNSTETTRNTRYNQAEERRDRAYKQAEAKRDYKSTASAYDALNERVTNIESYINPKYYITAEERAFERIIPANACPYIELNSVGGGVYRVSNNLLNPELFGTDVDERGYIYYPGSRNFYDAEITLQPGTYTVHSDVQFCLENHAEDAELFITKFTFTLTEEKKVKIILDGEMPEWYEPFWCWIMLNKGETALPFESYHKYAPVKYCDNLIPFPYLNKWSNPNDGINAIIDDNGVITVNGTYTGTAAVIDFKLAENMNLPIGKYTISGCTGTDKFRLFIWIKGGSTDRYIIQYSGATSFDINDGEYIFRLNIRITKDTQINNLVVKPMINKGETALPYEPYYEGTKSTKVTAIEHYGATLVDDVAFFTKVGFIKQSNGYWLGSNKTATIFTNTEKRAGSLSIAYMSKTLTANGTGNSVALALINYTDGTNEYKALTTDGTTEYGRKTYTTKADKTVDKIQFSYGITGTFEIKDLIINWGGVAPYHPYSAEPIFTINIPQSIQNLNGYGFGKIDFDNKKYIQEYDENGELSEPIITDISSDLIDFDSTIEVQAGGTLRFLNEAKAAVPSTISYLAKEGTV